MRHLIYESSEPARLYYITTGGNLDLSGSRLRHLDLTGARIGHGLRLGSSERRPPVWVPDATLTLRNAKVNELQNRSDFCKAAEVDDDELATALAETNQIPNAYDARWLARMKQMKIQECEPATLKLFDPWPKTIDLQGFTFEHFGAINEPKDDEMAKRSAEWWSAWLEKSAFKSLQPYQQVAGVLRAHGQDDKADDVLFEGKNQERYTALTNVKRHRLGEKGLVDAYVQFLSLSAQWALIGYGVGSRLLFVPLFWVLLFVGIGVGVLRVSNQGRRNKLPSYPIAFSFDMLVPLIKLDESHYKIKLTGNVQYYFYVHKIVGFLLASFIIAGISGLTK
jgi:hypothetical protein